MAARVVRTQVLYERDIAGSPRQVDEDRVGQELPGAGQAFTCVSSQHDAESVLLEALLMGRLRNRVVVDEESRGKSVCIQLANLPILLS